mmetsp:Transcript_16583/g.34672  ORF Transcript_16583/g.34672 Transcript_16583/m.34672 type:complete len:90 (+) Transcript_16583:748-1017(+)
MSRSIELSGDNDDRRRGEKSEAGEFCGDWCSRCTCGNGRSSTGSGTSGCSASSGGGNGASGCGEHGLDNDTRYSCGRGGYNFFRKDFLS